MSDSAWAIRCVWLRYYGVFRKNWIYGVITTFTEPILYFFSFGFGLARLVPTVVVGDLTIGYRPFLLSGLLGQAVLNQGFFEGAYGSYVRMYYQKIFKAMATTPVTLSEVLWGELFWDASKATFGAAAILLIGAISGDFSLWGSLVALPVCFISGLTFSAIGVWVSALSKTIEQIGYPQFLFIYPMMLFGGIYFPTNTLPSWLQTTLWIIPLTPVLKILRTLVLGLPFEPVAVPLLLGWAALSCYCCRRAMRTRLIA